METLSVAVLGAGLAGLSFAALASNIPNIRLNIFEKDQRIGGRTFTQEIDKVGFADLGANIIDFEHQQQEKAVREFLGQIQSKSTYEHKLKLLTQPFLIYDKVLRGGDYKKDRYCYQGGFKQLIQDLTSTIDKHSFLLGREVVSIQKNGQKWKVNGPNTQQFGQYDYVVVALDGPAALNLLQRSQLYSSSSLESLLIQSQYTTQISSAFQLIDGPPFSCILFQNNPLTFMSSHEQKYPKAPLKIVVIQMNETFSKQYYELSDEQIGGKIRSLLPEEMKTWIGQCFSVKRWRPSLIRNKTKRKLTCFQGPEDHYLMCGDICQGSSRVAGTIETSIEAFNMVLHQSLVGDL